MMLTANFPAERHKTIDDDWLNGGAAPVGDPTYGTDSVGAYVDCHKIWDGVNGEYITMSPRGITIESGAVAGSNLAYVNGYLWDENPAWRDNHPVPDGALMHSIRFLRIYRNNTTARGIRIYG